FLNGILWNLLNLAIAVALLATRWREDEVRLMEFVAGLTDEKLAVEFDYTSTEGGRHRRVLWEAMAHMVNHGTQHRSEAAAMLTAMGQSSGDIDLIVYLNEGERA
ncbi:MAG: DinB family protein, partial [Candidatus Rokuibacteriota bacterium]